MSERFEEGWALVWYVYGARDEKAPYLRDLNGVPFMWTGARSAAHLFATKEEALAARLPCWDPKVSRYAHAHARVVWIRRRAKT